MIDRKWIGRVSAPSVLPIERTRVQFFAKVIGETNPIYTDPAAAQAAGYRDVVAPPTFIFAAEMDSGELEKMVQELGIPLARMLHGEQEFRYFKPVCAGDVVTVQSTVADIFEKKGGALEFVNITASAVDQDGERVAELRSVLVCRN